MKPEQRERMLEIEESACAHFNGAIHGSCKAGVEYSAVRKGGTIPCVGCLNTGGATCAKYEPPSLAEIVAKRQQTEHLLTAHKLIQQAAYGRRGIRGTIQCPACQQPLNYAILGQSGHMRGQCSTTGCLSFIE